MVIQTQNTMKKDEIIFKLKKLLPKNIKSSFNTYEIDEILMLIRNLIESDKQNNFVIIKFFCDWMMHSKKDYIPVKIKSLFQEALKDEDSFVSRFLEAGDLHLELKKFFKVFRLPEILIDDPVFWQSFKSRMFMKIINRPIINPIPEIAEACFYDYKDFFLFFTIRYTKEKRSSVWPVFNSLKIKNKIINT